MIFFIGFCGGLSGTNGFFSMLIAGQVVGLPWGRLITEKKKEPPWVVFLKMTTLAIATGATGTFLAFLFGVILDRYLVAGVITGMAGAIVVTDNH